jgi:hypothetical protein
LQCGVEFGLKVIEKEIKMFENRPDALDQASQSKLIETMRILGVPVSPMAMAFVLHVDWHKVKLHMERMVMHGDVKWCGYTDDNMSLYELI